MVLEMVMDAVIQLTGAQRGFLVLSENGDLTLKTGRNFEQLSLNSTDMTISSTIVRRAVETGEPILVENAQQDGRFAEQASVISNQLLSVMVSPLRTGNDILGAIYIDNNDYSALFTADELELLGMFSEQAATAIHNAMEVKRREHELRSQISVLRIEIDEIKKAHQVAELTDNDDFREMAEKAKRLREERNRNQ
jgi:serine/threonine-protein kinase PknK